MERTIASPQAGTGNPKIGSIEWRSILAAFMSHLVLVWRKIRTGLWRVRNSLSPDISRPLDVERIATHLAVVRRAEEEGSRDLPPCDEEGPNGMQRQIIDYFANLRRRARQQFAESAEKLDRTLEQIKASDSLAKLQDVPAACENKIHRYVADSESRLKKAAEREQKQRQHYDAFRKKNGLDRVAHYPGAAHFYYLIAAALIVAVAFALVTIVEVGAAGNADVSGTWIVLVSAAAVILPFVVGDLWLRSINHVGAFRKSIGWIGAIAAIATILATAFYADFHIAVVLATPGATNPEVLDTILADPLGVVSSVASWKAFGLVGLTGLFAMLLAYRADDPYPGYGAVQRIYYRMRDTRDYVSSRLRKRINKLVDEAEAQIVDMANRFKNDVRTYTRLVEESEQNPSALNDYDAKLEDACNAVLDRYRVANAAARKSDLPLSFAEHVCFAPDDQVDTGQRSNSSGHVAELQAAVAELENEANIARQKLRALNLRMISSIGESQGVDTDSTA